jgi:arabinogalactan oligomer/maltooligosaccharide transport system substrate-binding protein
VEGAAPRDTTERIVKKISPWIAAATAAVLLASCSSGGNGTEPSASPDASDTSSATTEDKEPVTLVVWESPDGHDEVIKQAGEAYTAKNPHVTIEYKAVELGDSKTQIALDGPAGVGADVFAAPSDNAGDLAAAGHILAIANPDALKAELVEAAIANATSGGTLYGVPVTVDTYALFYNKDLIDEPPTTWEGVIEFSKEFNAENSGKYGFVMQPNFYYTAPFLFGGDSLLFGDSGSDPETPNTNSEAAIAGMEELVALRDVLNVAADDLDTATVDALFSGGQAAMHVSGPWNISVFAEAGVNYGIAPLPARAGSDTPSGGFSNSRTMYVSAYSKHPEEAQDFAAFLAGSIPAAEIQIDSEATLGIVKQGEYAFPTPAIPEMGAVWAAMDAAVANIWNGADIKKELDAATEVILNQ